MDTNEDAELDTGPGSADLFRPRLPPQVGRSLYTVDTVSVDGRQIVVEKSGEAEPRPAIEVGSPAPDFTATTLDGSPVGLTHFRGKPVVLVLTTLLPEASCPSCCEWLSGSSVSSSVPRCRLQEVEAVTSEFGDRVELLVVVTDSGPVDPKDLDLGRSSAVGVALPSLADLYRRGLGVFVIDQQGVIAAMDEVWTTPEGCSWPSGKVTPLSVVEIEGVLERLLGGR